MFKHMKVHHIGYLVRNIEKAKKFSLVYDMKFFKIVYAMN